MLPRSFPTCLNSLISCIGTLFTYMAKASLRPLDVVMYPARALEERVSLPLMASYLAVVPVLAWTFPFTGLSGATEVARDPSTPRMGRASRYTSESFLEYITLRAALWHWVPLNQRQNSPCRLRWIWHWGSVQPSAERHALWPARPRSFSFLPLPPSGARESACIFWLTFSISFKFSEKGGEVRRATLCSFE